MHIALERGRLTASVANQPAVELIPITASEFYVLEGGVHVTFVKDEGGKIVALKGFQKGQPFYAKRID